MKKIVLVLSFAVLAALGSGEALGQQVSIPLAYGIATSPFASPFYTRGVTQLKMEAEYLTVNGTDASFAGGGVDGVVRSTFTDVVAASVQVGLFGMRGSSDDVVRAGGSTVYSHSNLSQGELLAGVNGEFQVLRAGGMSIILLAGPLAELFYGTVDTTFGSPVPLSGLSDSGSVMSVLYGLQGGGQVGIDLGPARLSMFALLQNLQGTSRIAWSLAGRETAEVHPVYETNAGIELAIPAWDVSVGMQSLSRPGSGSMRGYRATLWRISWSF